MHDNPLHTSNTHSLLFPPPKQQVLDIGRGLPITYLTLGTSSSKIFSSLTQHKDELYKAAEELGKVLKWKDGQVELVAEQWDDTASAESEGED